MSARGRTPLLNLPRVLREHRDRLRALEASPGNPRFDGYHAVSFQNGWHDHANAGTLDSPCGYGKTSAGWVSLIGRMDNSVPWPALSRNGLDDDLQAFTLPVGFRPPYTLSFPVAVGSSDEATYNFGGGPQHKGAGGHGLLRVDASGIVRPTMPVTGYGSEYGYVADDFSTYALDVFLPQEDWRRLSTVGVYAAEGAGVGIKTGVSIGAPNGHVYLGTGIYADCEVGISVTNAATTGIKLGVHCPPHMTDFGSVDNPGIWMSLGNTVGSGVQSYICDPIRGPFDQFENLAISPGFTAGDYLSLRIVEDELLMFKNRVEFHRRSFPPGVGFASGLMGMGLQGPSSVELAADFRVGLPWDASIALDGVYFNVNA